MKKKQTFNVYFSLEFGKTGQTINAIARREWKKNIHYIFSSSLCSFEHLNTYDDNDIHAHHTYLSTYQCMCECTSVSVCISVLNSFHFQWDTHTKLFPMVKIMECIFRINYDGLQQLNELNKQCGMKEMKNTIWCTTVHTIPDYFEWTSKQKKKKKKLRSKLMSKWQSPWCFHSLCFAFYFDFVVVDSHSVSLLLGIVVAFVCTIMERVNERKTKCSQCYPFRK